MKPRKDYIVLNGTEGSANGNNIQFLLQPHMFRNYSANDNMTIKLISYSFSFEFGSASQGGHSNIRADIACRNEYRSSGDVFLASQTYIYELIGAEHYFSSNEMICSAEIDCEPFTEINLGLYIGSTQMVLSTAERNDTQFVFEIEYTPKFIAP